jgi:hypothetical protein
MFRKLHPVLLAFLVMMAASCSKDDNTSASKGKYDNGYFIINEGNFNHETGSVHFFSYAKDSLSEYVYDTENPGKTLGTNQQALEYAAIFNSKLYLVVNYGGPLVVTDAYSLKESGRINSLPDAAQSHAFVGVDANRGLISTDKGIYPLNLSTVTVGNKISGIDASTGDMVKAGNYIFVLTSDKGIIALNSNDYSIAKTIGAATTGFAVGNDGDVWAATPNSLLKIHVSTLAVDTINTTFNIYYNPYVYTSGSIVASTKENAVYVISQQSAVYKYVVGNTASLSAPFITLPEDHYTYGKGIGYDASKDELVLTTAESIYGGPVNTVYSYSASTGTASNSFVYNGYYYPAMIVFH